MGQLQEPLILPPTYTSLQPYIKSQHLLVPVPSLYRPPFTILDPSLFDACLINISSPFFPSLASARTIFLPYFFFRSTTVLKLLKP